jgi:pimeloyl-ACP methyl ester carboxylesterase
MIHPALTIVSRRSFMRLLLLAAVLVASLPAWSLSPLAPGLSIEVDGVKVNYTSTVKAPQDLTLVLIHGFAASLEAWFDVHPALAANFQVVRLDLLGHGYTDKPRTGDYSPQGHARLVTRFLEKLGLKRVVLAGHSMGGGIALLTIQNTLTQSRTFEVAGLVLISSSGYPQRLPFFIEVLRDPVQRFLSQLIPVEQRTRYTLEKLFFLPSRLTAERVHRYAYFATLPGSPHALTQTALLISPPDVEQLSTQIPQVRVPTLILWGDQDRTVPVENAHRFHRDIKGSALQILPQTGHMSPEERPEQIIDFIEKFSKSLQ